jgi:glycosyltransferase involved in cell wall biosynthesis
VRASKNNPSCRKVLLRVPCYNHEHYVEQCLESIAAQDYPALEVIVIDDASTDGTALIAERLCRRHGFRFLRNEHNLGVSGTLNKITKAASDFDYVFSIASDDILPLGSISAMANILTTHPEAVGAYGDVEYIDMAGRPLGLMRNSKESGDIFTKVLFSEISIPWTWIMWTKAAYDSFGGYDEDIAMEDSYAFAKMAKLGHLRYAGALVVRYRKHAGNTTSNAWHIYQSSCRVLDSLRGETFYPKLSRLYGSEHFFLLSRRHKLEALYYLPAALTRPFRRQFWAGLINLIGLGFIVDRFIRK